MTLTITSRSVASSSCLYTAPIGSYLGEHKAKYKNDQKGNVETGYSRLQVTRAAVNRADPLWNKNT